MFKGARARERVFAIAMWAVSIVLAGFLIGFGGLVIGDLPKVSDPVRVESFVDPVAEAQVARTRAELARSEQAMAGKMQVAEAELTAAREDDKAAQASFANWIATRTATANRGQDPEVVARTRALDALKAKVRTAEAAQAAVANEELARQQAYGANEQRGEALRVAAGPRFEAARFGQELQVFALRLALTLPLLAISTWFLMQKAKGDYWPLKRGFVLFSAFAFFVELVPYLPEYGGYVRYGVGIALTLVAGAYGVRWMRGYLAGREVAEAKAETVRKSAIQYDEALKKMAAHTCPGCERTLAASETPADFCMHCGMHLFNHCAQCGTRKFAFFRYCMGCGTPATGAADAG